MNKKILSLLLLGLISFSACAHQPATDAGTDEALGVDTAGEAAAAQQDLARVQDAQREEQRRQLYRTITDSTNQSTSNR